MGTCTHRYIWVRQNRRPRMGGGLVKCPGWDSNPHCTGFESVSSCQLGYRGIIWTCHPEVRRAPAVADATWAGTSLAVPGSLVRVTQSARRVVIAEDEALIRLDLKEMLEE